MQATIDFYAAPPAPAAAAFGVVLVGVEFEENLSLRYLTGALLAAGYLAVRVQPYNGIGEAEQLAVSIAAEQLHRFRNRLNRTLIKLYLKRKPRRMGPLD